MATPGRIQEAEKHLVEAQKCMKTGLLKWSPDYAGAASSYDKAAICFRNSRDTVRATDSYLKAAECHYNNHAIYHSGKSIEQAANVARDSKQLEEAAKLYQRASERYNESGHPDTAGQILLKGAQLLQHEIPGLAAKYFLATADYFELDEKFREAANSIKNAVRMYCRTRPRQYDQIIETARLSRISFLRAGAINMAHEAISVEIIAMLMKGQALDSLDVLQEADNVPEFRSSEERSMLEQLIDAVNQKDDETVAQSCDSGIFKAMDPEFAKLARDLKTGTDSADPVRPNKQKSVPNPTKEPSKAAPIKDIRKKNTAELADMRNQLLTKSTGEKTSSKMPKPRSTYKSTPSDNEPETRGLEEQPPRQPKVEQRKDEPQENKKETTEENTMTAESNMRDPEADSQESGAVVENKMDSTEETPQGDTPQEDTPQEDTPQGGTQQGDEEEDDEDEPIDFN